MGKNRAEEIYTQIKKQGIKAIDGFIVDRKSEELFLDFKRSASGGAHNKLHDDDRKNLAKAISGFGNSEGGVIVWGIDCPKDADGADVAKYKSPLKDVAVFASWVEGAISGCTVPPHSKVENFVIKDPNGKEGFLVTFVPFSNNAPHQSVVDHRYYMRAGSNFVPVPHAVLSGMFGRRPQPWVFLMFSVGPAKIKMVENQKKEVSCQIGFMITNDGLGIARDIFLNVEIYHLPGDACQAWYNWSDQVNWTGSHAFGFKLGLISKEGFRIPPRDFAQPVVLNLTLIPPFDKGFNIKVRCGCEGSEIFEMELKSDKDNVERIYNELINLPDLTKSQEQVGKLLNMKQGEMREEPEINTTSLK